MAPLPAVLLAETDGAEFGRAEHGGGDVEVVELDRLAPELRAHEGHRLGDGDRGQGHPLDHVPEREDVAHAGAVVVVDQHRAGLGDLDADGLEAEPLGVRASPGGHELHVRLELGAVVEHGDDSALGLPERIDGVLQVHVHAVEA